MREALEGLETRAVQIEVQTSQHPELVQAPARS